MTAKVLRLAALQKKLNRLPAVAKKRIRDAMENGAEEITDLMRSLVPEGVTGELKKSIGWVWGGKVPKGSIVLATVVGAGLGQDLTITIYAGNETAYYARWVEFGTVKNQAKPYFFVSYRALKKRVKTRIGRNINKAAKEVANGG